MLKLRDLAIQPDFQLGSIDVSPSRRLIAGPAGEMHVAPLIMQVLLILLDARGSVVTRNELFDQCWGAATVGDDSLNRAVLKVRRVLEEVAPGQVEIETIPRTGYRLTLAASKPQSEEEPGETASDPRLSRRVMVAGGAAAAAMLGGGLWFATRDETGSQFDAVMAQGNQALLSGAYDDPNSVRLLEQAVAIEPRSAKAWGLLAFFRSNQLEAASADDADRLVRGAELTVRRALEIDSREPNALTAMFILQSPMRDWAAREREVRNVLAIDGNNIPAMRELMILLQAAGFTRESWSWNERILALAPFSRPHLVVRAQKLWILGRMTEADKVIDHVRGLWPHYPFAFFVRLMLFALTDRPRAARALLESAPDMVRPESAALWRVLLKALDTHAPADVEAARLACIGMARKDPKNANLAVMVLGALGQTEAALETAEGFLLSRGKVISSDQSDSTVNNFNRRNTPWLFTPPLAAMRADPRFLRLCEEFGLTAYWRARGVKPDFMRT